MQYPVSMSSKNGGKYPILHGKDARWDPCVFNNLTQVRTYIFLNYLYCIHYVHIPGVLSQMKPMTLEDSKAGGGRALKGWACQLCGYFTKHRHHCTEHMYNRHAKPEHLPCPFCGKVFTKRPAHRLHKLKCSKKHQNAYNWLLKIIVIYYVKLRHTYYA